MTEPSDPIMQYVNSGITRTSFYDRNAHRWWCMVPGSSEYRRYSGMLKRIKRAFYPTFRAVKRRKKGSRSTSSRAIGTSVDVVCEDVINNGMTGLLESDATSSKAKKFFHALRELDITPLIAEATVVSHEKGFATKVDVMGYRHMGTPLQEFVTVERKTGYSVGAEVANRASRHNRAPEKEMRGALSNVKNTQANQHQLQSLVPTLVLRREYGIRVDRAYVVYVDWEGTEGYLELPDWCKGEAIQDAIYAQI